VADRVSFELVSPARLLVSEAVDMVVIPGTEGDFGVLPGHSLLISMIRPGVINVYEGDRVTERIFVAGGFADVTPEGCTVLAEEAIVVDELDVSAIESELSDLRDDLRDAKDDTEVVVVERRITIAEAKITATRAA
jgi:F-type H+-transporting ATPase subunit epsilon